MKIEELVSYVNDYAGDAVKFKNAFAGQAPANRNAYAQFQYTAKPGSTRVDGADGSASVEFRTDASPEVVATKEWTFTRVGDRWKIKSAPLR